MADTEIICGADLFGQDTLNKLEQLEIVDPEETIIEVRCGEYFSCSAFDPNSSNLMYSGTNSDNEINTDWKICPTCKLKLHDLGMASSTCSQCGTVLEKNSEEQDIKKNTSFSGSTTTSYFNCDSKAYVRTKIIKELKQKSIDSVNHKIPQYIIEEAVDLFLAISEYKIHRGYVQRALKAKLIQYKLIEYGMIKPSKVIAQMFGLSDKQLSAADALIREYDAAGIIKIPCLNVDRTDNFIRNYINTFKIDIKYATFIAELINEADIKKIHLLNNFKPSTKATGAFILFLCSFPELELKKSDVIKESGLTSSTVNRYFNLLIDNIHLLTNVYKRWNIKPPSKEIKKENKTTPPIEFTIKLVPLPNV